MFSRNDAATLFKWFVTTLYSGPVETLAQRLGIDRMLFNLYFHVYLLLGNGTRMVTVGNSMARFRVTTRTEYGRVDRLMDERPVVENLLSNLHPDDVFYDIGANIGIYSCLAGSKLKTGQVVAFEPHPPTADRLKENIRLNNFSAILCRYALSDFEEEVEFAVCGEVGAGEHALVPGTSQDQLQVNTISGDTLIEKDQLRPPNVLKIDVEGGELGVVRGLRDTLARSDCRLVYCEVHPEKITQYGSTEGKIRDEFEAAGFQTDRIHERDDEYFLRAEK